MNLAIRHEHLEVVLYLVNECLQDISVSPSSKTFVDEAIKSGNDNILLFLLSCGLKFSSNTSQASFLSSSLVQPALKVCVLGNSESGKSTLVKALMSNLVEGGWFNSILYDFASQYEDYS